MSTLIHSRRGVAILHIPKTGGRARDEIMRAFGFCQCYPRVGHVRLCDFQTLLDCDPLSFDKVVAVIRNPFERELSHWAFSKEHEHLAKNDNQYDAPCRHNSVNTFVWDWECSPLHYYERHWYPQCYETQTSWGDYLAMDAYRYWYTIDGKVPDNVTVVKLEHQDEYLSDIVGMAIDIPRMGVSEHLHWSNEFNAEGIEGVRRLYHKTFDEYYPEARQQAAAYVQGWHTCAVR